MKASKGKTADGPGQSWSEHTKRLLSSQLGHNGRSAKRGEARE